MWDDYSQLGANRHVGYQPSQYIGVAESVQAGYKLQLLKWGESQFWISNKDGLGRLFVYLLLPNFLNLE